MHRYYSESSLTDSVKQNAYIDVALLFYYRCTQALMSAYFKYPADPKLAEAAFARLSHKFLIKRLGTWGKVIEFRAKELFEKESIHLKTIKGYNDDAMIIYMINDSQGRIRSMMKSYAEVFYAAYEENDRVGSTTSVVTDMEGKESVKEKTKSIESIVTYMRQTLIDEDSFVKKEMVDVIYSVNKNTSTRMIDQTLRYMCRSYNDSKKMKQIDDFVSSVVVYSFYLIDQEIKPKSYRDLPVILTKLKNLYLSTRTIDEEMIRIRDMGQSIVNDSVAGQTYHKSLLMATRTSLLLYISLRALISKM
jgi:hypothetical protein